MSIFGNCVNCGRPTKQVTITVHDGSDANYGMTPCPGAVAGPALTLIDVLHPNEALEPDFDEEIPDPRLAEPQ